MTAPVPAVPDAPEVPEECIRAAAEAMLGVLGGVYGYWLDRDAPVETEGTALAHDARTIAAAVLAAASVTPPQTRVEWAVMGHDELDGCGFIDSTPEDQADAERQIRRHYSYSHNRDVRVVQREVTEWREVQP